MNPSTHLTDVQSALAQLRRAQTITFVVGALAVLLAVKDMGRNERIVLEPPTRTKTITILGDRVDAAWYEEMGIYVAHMMLDVSPATIGWQQEQILKWVHPSTHGLLQQAMSVQAKRLQEANASTTFWMRQIAPDPERSRVAVLGTLDTSVNGIKVAGSSREVAYLAEFQSKSGRLLLKEWKEVPGDDIWLVKLLEQERLQAEKDAATQAKSK